jgi:hypothetical protein
MLKRFSFCGITSAVCTIALPAPCRARANQKQNPKPCAVATMLYFLARCQLAGEQSEEKTVYQLWPVDCTLQPGINWWRRELDQACSISGRRLSTKGADAQ